MKNYDFIIIGFGKAGKTIAKQLAQKDYRIAMVEQSAKMYGGTCINVACIPTKTLLHEGLATHSFDASMQRKFDVVEALNAKNYTNLADEEAIDIYTLKAQFLDNHRIELLDEDGQVQETLKGDKFIINTGARTNIPNIKGIDTAQNLYDSEGIMEIAKQPKNLIIIGAGPIALEFATIFSNFGTKVTIIHRDKHLLSSEDRDVGYHLYDNLIAQGIEFVDEAESHEFSMEGDLTLVHTNQGDYKADAVLLATGRIPNIDLGLENTDIKLADKGHIEVNPHLQTSVDHIYAVGDVKGGPQFTYISLDDSRIVMDHLTGEGKRTTENRGAIPNVTFLDPPLARVGLVAGQARKQGYTIKEGSLEVKNIPRHKINNDDRGIFKVVVDADTNMILGASLYGKQAEELINLIKIAMDNDLPYSVLRDNIYTHPTMAESFNDLFNV